MVLLLLYIYIYQLGTGRCTQKAEPVRGGFARPVPDQIVVLHSETLIYYYC